MYDVSRFFSATARIFLVSFFALFLAVSSPVIAADKYEETRASLAQSTDAEVNDPIEGLNRVIFDVNEFLYALILRPLGEMYQQFLPDFVQDAVHSAASNLNSPVVLANDLLQGEFDRAWVTTQRLVINSTVGLGGVYDAADKFWEIKGHKEDVGQTLAVWGVGEGFYLVLPIFGPSNPRDAVGLVLNSYMDPLTHYLGNTDRDAESFARTMVSGVDEFSRVMGDLQKLKDTSVDYYAALRSISRQKRAAEIRNSPAGAGAPLPDLQYDLNADLQLNTAN